MSARRPVLRVALIAFAAFFVTIVVVVTILLIDANWLRKPISSYISSKLERPFAINGDLRIGLFPHVHVELNDVLLGNAPWGTRAEMLKLQQGVVSIKLLPLFRKRVVLPEVRLVGPDIWLERNGQGEANWTFGQTEGTPSEPGTTPEIGSLWIEAGKIAFRDPPAKTAIALQIDSDRSAPNAESRIQFTGNGNLRGESFQLDGSAGSPLALTETGKPYKIAVAASAGDLKAAFDGTLVPLKLESIDGNVSLKGKDLSKLYPLIPLPLPWTPPFSVSGHITRAGAQYSLRELKGKVGSSDVNGTVAIDLGNKRPFMTLDIVSKKLDYKDLLGLLGSPPPGAGQARSKEQQKTAERLEDAGKALSSKPYSLERLRTVDADVKFKGESIIARDIPLDNVAFQLKLKGGKLTLEPLKFGLAKGQVEARITLDASQDIIQTRVDATATNLEAKELMPQLKEGGGSAGKIGGRLKLATKGNSVAQMAASANGEADLVMGSGRLSTIALVLTNLDLANAIKYVLRGNPNAPVYCAVIQASAHDGIVQPNLFVIDSSEENIAGEGQINLKDEAYDLRIKAKSKRVSLVALRGPIHIGGTFKDPKIMPEVGPLAARAGAAVALGALLTPLASLLALVDLGGGKDSNCSALVAEAKKETATTPVAPPKRADPAKTTTQDTTPEKRRPGTQ